MAAARLTPQQRTALAQTEAARAHARAALSPYARPPKGKRGLLRRTKGRELLPRQRKLKRGEFYGRVEKTIIN